MVTLLDRLKTLQPWQTIVIAVVVVGAMVGGIFAFTQNSSSENGSLEDGQQLVELRRGDLVNQITSSGSIVFSNRESLFFGAQGTVAEVSVAVGDQVTAGQELARMDDDTIAQLQKTLAQAQFDLQKATDAYELAHAPQTPLELAQAQAAVANAELKFDLATTALEEIQNPIDLAILEDAQSQETTAQSSLASAQNDLAYQQVDQASKVQAAKDALTKAKEGYQGTITNFLGMTLAEAEYKMTPDEFLSSHAINLDFLFAPLQRDDPISSILAFSPELVENPNTDWSEFTVYTWLTLFPGNIYGTCVNLTLRSQDVCVGATIDASWTTMDKALSTWGATNAAAAKTISSALKSVDQATTALAAAEDKLQIAIDGAKPLEIMVKQREMEVAEAQLVEANDALAEVIALPDSLTLALRDAEMNAAAAAVVTAEQKLALTVLTAPFNGFIGSVNVEVGRAVGANAAAIEVIDPSVAEVEAQLDEIDVLTVQVGSNALVSLDGLPRAQLPGVVISISQAGDNQLGVVTYPIHIEVQTPGRLQLREGLSATANIVLQQELDVLLIPSTSIAGTIEQPTVMVSIKGEITEREVTLGSSDGFWTIALTGLEEGDMVVSTTLGGSTNPFSGAGMRIGGGFGGGGGRLPGGFGGGNFTGGGGRPPGGFGGGGAGGGRTPPTR
jgi:macrolide-specific efflux system membrane fusion protein